MFLIKSQVVKHMYFEKCRVISVLLFCLEVFGWGLVWKCGIVDWVGWIEERGAMSLRDSVSRIKW